LVPHAGLVLPGTARVATSVVILPTGTALPQGAIDKIAEILRVLLSDVANRST
jgi:hypothetical protein